MNQDKLFLIINKLNLPAGEWVAFGGSCLTARNIRDTNDLELFVTPKLYMELKNDDWEEKITGSTGASYVTRVYENIPILAFITCGSDKWHPDVERYLRDPEIIHGLPFMPILEMYHWKMATARPKDLEDVKLIDTYLTSHE